jgi:hypothetical protein
VKLWAISDVHVGHAENRRLVADLPAAHPAIQYLVWHPPHPRLASPISGRCGCLRPPSYAPDARIGWRSLRRGLLRLSSAVGSKARTNNLPAADPAGAIWRERTRRVRVRRTIPRNAWHLVVITKSRCYETSDCAILLSWLRYQSHELLARFPVTITDPH